MEHARFMGGGSHSYKVEFRKKNPKGRDNMGRHARI
jgi:hypothetical protein